MFMFALIQNLLSEVDLCKTYNRSDASCQLVSVKTVKRFRVSTRAENSLHYAIKERV